MSSSERAALNAPRTKGTMSSQMSAIMSCKERDEEASPPSGAAVKGKLDMKHEDEIKREEGESENHIEGGKNVDNDKTSIKTEIKTEPMDESEIKEEPFVKEEPRSPSSAAESTTDVKPTTTIEPVQSTTLDKKRKCSKLFFIFYSIYITKRIWFKSKVF